MSEQQEKKNRFTNFVYPLVGIVSLTAGFTWIYHPLGPIAFGAILLTIAVLGKKQ